MAAPGSLHQYIINLRSQGASPDLVKIVTEICFRSRKRGVSPVYSLGHLAHLASLSYERVDQIVVGSAEDNYDHFSIEKKSGGKRNILAPKSELMSLQGTILETAIPNKLVSDAAHGYVRQRDTLTAASCHVGAKSLITLDVQGFYDSITHKSIYPIFVENGYPKLTALQMTLLTTVGLKVSKREDTSDSAEADFLYEIKGVGRLPQGAPTSGALSNVVMRPLDDEIEMLGMTLGATYTRYADDLQFSFNSYASNSVVSELISGVRLILDKERMQLNKDKTRVQRNSKSMKMLGLCISETGISVDSKYRRKLLAFIRAIDKYGVESVASKHGKESGLEVLASLEGHFLYVQHVDPLLSDSIEPAVQRILGKARLR